MKRIFITAGFFVLSTISVTFATNSVVPETAISYLNLQQSKTVPSDTLDLSATSTTAVPLSNTSILEPRHETTLETPSTPDIELLPVTQLSQELPESHDATLQKYHMDREVADTSVTKKLSDAISAEDSSDHSATKCYDMRIPKLQILNTKIATLPTAKNMQLTSNFRAYVEDLIATAEARQQLVSIALLRSLLQHETITTSALIQILRTYAESSTQPYVRELFCTAVFPISEELQFSATEAAAFYYALSNAFYSLQDFESSRDALNLALSYAETDTYYNFYITLSDKLSGVDADAAYVIYADYLNRTKGPAAALDLLEAGLRKYPSSRRIINRFAAMLNGISPADAAAFRL